MISVQSVRGNLERSNLGIVAVHEHVFIDLSAFYQSLPVLGCDDPKNAPVEMENLGVLSRDPYALRDNLLLNDREIQKKEIMFFKNAGGRTIVDATMPGIGRNPVELKKLSEETGLNIIMGTGYYVGETHPDRLDTMTKEEIAMEMTGELIDGIGDTGIRAGFIGEIGISEIFDDRERKVLKASAIAQKATGVAVHVHINPWTVNGVEAAQILLKCGVDASRINICHIDVENREDYIFELLKMGVFIEFDNFGKEYYVRREVRNSGYGLFARDTERVMLLKKLIDAGYLRQILLSCDVCLKILLHTYGGWGYDHVLSNIVPMMQDAGITDRQIQILLENNPADFLLGR